MLLELRNVSKRYDAVSGAAGVEVLRGVNLVVEPGQSLSIVGPSGSGKTTLLNIMGTLDQPTNGQVVLEGRDLATLSEKELAAVRARRIGWVFQSHHLLPQLTAMENVLVPTLAAGAKYSDGAAERAGRLLERVGLGGRLSHRPAQLSGGERQRVAVVRALINRPSLLLADEPTGSLDRHAAETLAEILVALNRDEGVAMVVATHSMDLARRMARTLTLRDGGVTEA